MARAEQRRGLGGLRDWAAGLGDRRQFGIEGAGNDGRGLAQHLVAAGEPVYAVNPRWTAQSRRRARRLDQKDRLDARTVAGLVWREAGTLPRVPPDDETAILDLLVTEREGVLAEATRLRQQIHHRLLQIDPGSRTHLPKLQTKAGWRALLAYPARSADALQPERAAAVRRLAQRLERALAPAEDLARQVRSRAETGFSPLTRLCGVDVLTAGALAGILGLGRRFATDAQLAASAGVAPLEPSSADLVRHRRNRGGNRRLNAIRSRIARTQARRAREARAYLARRVGEGKTGREATRALKRFLIRAVWRRWQECPIPSTPGTTSRRPDQ